MPPRATLHLPCLSLRETAVEGHSLFPGPVPACRINWRPLPLHGPAASPPAPAHGKIPVGDSHGNQPCAARPRAWEDSDRNTETGPAPHPGPRLPLPAAAGTT